MTSIVIYIVNCVSVQFLIFCYFIGKIILRINIRLCGIVYPTLSMIFLLFIIHLVTITPVIKLTEVGSFVFLKYIVCCLLFVVCFLLFVVCCLLFVVCCLLFVFCCLLFVVCCLLFVVCCLLFVVYCLLFIVCCLLFVVCFLLFIVCCKMFLFISFFVSKILIIITNISLRLLGSLRLLDEDQARNCAVR